MPGDEGKSYFAAAGGPTGLTAGIAELEALRQNLSAPKNNVITPTTGAGAYWHVDPSVGNQPFNPMESFDNQGDQVPTQLEGIGLLPKDSPNILKQNVLGNAPRIADASPASRQMDQWYSDTVHSYFQRPPSLDHRYNPDPESGQFQPSLIPQQRRPGTNLHFDPSSAGWPNSFLT